MAFEHNQTRTLTVLLNGEEQDVEVECTYSVARAESDVGLFSDYVDDLYLDRKDVEAAISLRAWNDLCTDIMEDHV